MSELLGSVRQAGVECLFLRRRSALRCVHARVTEASTDGFVCAGAGVKVWSHAVMGEIPQEHEVCGEVGIEFKNDHALRHNDQERKRTKAIR